MSWRDGFETVLLGCCIVAGCMVLVHAVLSINAAQAGRLGAGENPTLTCPLAQEVQEASATRVIYLGGVAEQTDSVVETITLSVEIEALEQLRRMMIVWRGVNCSKERE